MLSATTAKNGGLGQIWRKPRAREVSIGSRTRSRTSVGSSRSTRQPAQVTSVQTVLCSVPRRAPFLTSHTLYRSVIMKRTLIAAAVLSTLAASSAYAECTAGCDPAELFTATNVYTDIGEFGFITLRGRSTCRAAPAPPSTTRRTSDIGGVNMKTPPQSYTSGKRDDHHQYERYLEQRERRRQRLAASPVVQRQRLPITSTNTQGSTASSQRRLCRRRRLHRQASNGRIRATTT